MLVTWGGSAKLSHPLTWAQYCWSPVLGPSLCLDLSARRLWEKPWQVLFLAFDLYLCEAAVDLNHGRGDNAKDPKTLGPTTRAPLSLTWQRILILE